MSNLQSNKFAAVILAAGKGSRMKSDLPKVMHKIDGRPLIDYVVESAEKSECDRIVVVKAPDGELVENYLKDSSGKRN